MIGTPVSLGSASDAVAGTTFALTVAAPVAVGQKIVAFAVCPATAPGPTCTFTDSQSNTWATSVSATATQNVSAYIGGSIVTNPLTTADTITMTLGTSQAGHLLAAISLDGMLNNNAANRTQNLAGTIVNWGTGTTSLTTVQEQIVVGVCGLTGAAATSTPTGSATELFDFDNGSLICLTASYYTVQALGTYNVTGTWTSSPGGWNAAVATFRGNPFLRINPVQVPFMR